MAIANSVQTTALAPRIQYKDLFQSCGKLKNYAVTLIKSEGETNVSKQGLNALAGVVTLLAAGILALIEVPVKALFNTVAFLANQVLPYREVVLLEQPVEAQEVPNAEIPVTFAEKISAKVGNAVNTIKDKGQKAGTAIKNEATRANTFAKNHKTATLVALATAAALPTIAGLVAGPVAATIATIPAIYPAVSTLISDAASSIGSAATSAWNALPRGVVVVGRNAALPIIVNQTAPNFVPISTTLS